MGRNYFKANFLGKEYNITRTSHIGQTKEGNTKSRDEGIYKQGFETLISQAFKHGLNQHRNSKVVLTFTDFTNRRISILIEHFGDSIELISAFRNWDNDDFKANYITIKNRINLTYFWSLPKPGKEGNKVYSKPLVIIRPKPTKLTTPRNKHQIRFIKKGDK